MGVLDVTIFAPRNSRFQMNILDGRIDFQRLELRIMRDEESDGFFLEEMLRHGPSKSNSVFVGRRSTQLVDEDKGACGRVVTNECRLFHLIQEGRYIVFLIIGVSDSATDAVASRNRRLRRWDVRTTVREDGDERNLLQVGGLAGS